MTQAHAVFGTCMDRAGALVQIGSWLENKPLGGLDRSECCRAAVVLGVSALDHYVHALVLEAVEQMLLGHRPPTPRFEAMKVPLRSARNNLGSAGWGWAIAELREQQSILTYQRPSKISEGMKWVDSRSGLWPRLALRMTATADDLRTRLELLVDRRNRIAHEGDIDPAWGTARPLAGAEVDDALVFVGRLVDSIEAECW